MRGYAMGAVDYVFKPVDPVVLKSKVAVFVDLYLLRRQIEDQARAEQELREAKLQADTERLAVERELQQTRLRQAAILESLPLALYEAGSTTHGRLRPPLRRRRRAPRSRARTHAALAAGEPALGRPASAGDRSGGARPAHRRLPRAARLALQYRWSRSDGRRSMCSTNASARRRTARRMGRHADRRDRPARARAATGAGPQGRGARPADRRRRARFQQPARRGARRAAPARDAASRSASASSRSSTICATRPKAAPSWSAG